jgi:Alpha/beta hydrolase domain
MTDAQQQVEVTGPIPGTGANRMPAVLGERYGYVEEEYFLEGRARSYAVVGGETEGGHWTVEPDGTAPFKTRVLVRRPADMDAFNGTVVVDWFNVTAGVDGDPDFGLLYPVLMGGGFAYVGVSAQQVAIGGGQSALDIPGVPNTARKPLTEANPERYGTLVHPGDAFSYDLYALVAAAVRRGDLLGGTTPGHVLAVGESQSAFRLVAFINAIQPLTGAFDGFLVHSRGGSSAPVAGSEVQGRPEEGPPVRIRTDIEVPVLQFETETDLVLLGYLAARQPDTDRIVTWEVAGAAHADASLLEYGRIANPDVEFDLGEFIPTMNRGPQREVLRAAFIALHDWVVSGTRPPAGDLIETVDGHLRRDADGNAIGGIRTPAVDAPVAAHSGESDRDEIIFQLFGSTIPFTPEQLRARYPTHDDYVAAVTSSADAAVAARFLLPDDRDRIFEEARAAPVPT